LAPQSSRFELAAFGVAIVLLVLVEYLGQRSSAALVETAATVEHTHQVIEHLDALLTAVVDAETGRRGYALTGDDDQLEPYRDAASRTGLRIAELRQLTRDNSEQLRRLDDLEVRVKGRLALLADAVDQTRARAGDDRAREAVETVHGKPAMNAVRATIATMIAAERELLAKREQQTRERVAESRNVQLGGAGLGVALLVFVVVRLKREIRVREASEERTRQNEEDLATTLESIGDGVIATDADGRVTRMNPVAASITGWKFEDARGRPVTDVFHLIHDATKKEVQGPVAEALRLGKTAEISDAALLVAKNGTKHRVADSASPIRASDGTLRGAVLVFRDITKLLEDARQLRRTHAFLDSIVENIPDMVFVKDAEDLAFVRFNRAGEKLLDLKREELLGKTDFAFFPPDQAKAFVEKDRETLRRKTIVEIPEEPLTTPSGVRWLSTKKVPVLGDDGEPEYLLGISADITDRRRADVLLRASREATDIAHRELEAFSYSVAHDLRAPLRSIDGFSQALLDDYADKLDDEGRAHLSRVRNAARRMAELIDDLLGLARVSRTELTRTHVDLTAIAREVGEVARKDHNPEAELKVAEGLSASADGRLVRVLLENLIGNAFKFSSRRDDARVEVGKEVENGVDVFFVKDNGAGFDLAAANKLFTAFQRYHRPTEFDGTGIGLATAQRIVARHGGRIWAESAPDRGASFHFILDRGDTK
jgi:PAS domain S-box-containing protein